MVTTVLNDLHRPTLIFFLEEVDMLPHNELNSSFRIFIPTVLKKRGDNFRKIDVLRYGVSQSQLMERMCHKHILS
jgi:hypothetical protein